jgi:hypothetical protein
MSSDTQSVAIYDGVRTSIRPPLGPGVTGRLEALVESPSTPGNYALRMTLVQEGVQWFDSAPINVLSDAIISVLSERSTPLFDVMPANTVEDSARTDTSAVEIPIAIKNQPATR